jgi:hypothetical protein
MKTQGRKKIAALTLFVLAFVLGACVPMQAGAPAFPTGTLQMEGNQYRALQFNQDGTFGALDAGTVVAKGTYSAKGDVYTEESNDQGCPTPRHYRFTFDGSKLVFHPLEDPKTDTCPGRKADFSETVTWMLVKQAQLAD